MVQNIIITLSLFFSLNSYAQDFQKVYDQKVEENMVLKDSIKDLKKEFNKSIELLESEKKSMSGDIKGLKDKISDLSKELNSTDFKDKKTSAELIKQKELLITALKFSNDSLKEVQKTNLNLFQQLENDKNQILREQQRLLESEQNVLSILNKKYNSDAALIIKYDIESVNKDLEICKLNSTEHSELENKINNCITIKKAELLLCKKFNEHEVQDFIGKLQLLPSNPTILKLIKDLSEYKTKNESIKSLINSLEGINKIKVKGTDRLLIEEKQKEIYTTIYFETESIDLTKYVYLNQIIKKIYSIKEEIDASVYSIINDL